MNSKQLKYFWLKLASTFTALCLLWLVVSLFSFSGKKTESPEDKKYLQEFYNRYAVYAIQLPDNLSFANEKVPIEYFDVYENLDKEFLVNTYWHSQIFLFIKRAYRYFPIIEPILKENGIPNDFKYLCVAESGLSNVVSPAGASGFWQFIRATATKYGLEVNDEIDERYNLEKSTKAACDYLKESYRNYKNWTLVAASYNAGMGGIDNQVKKQKVNSYYDLMLNEETSRYVYRIIAIKTIMDNPLNYGIHYRKRDLYPPIPTEKIIVDTNITDLASFAIDRDLNYKMLKYFNPWLRQNSITITLSKIYALTIPQKGYRDLNKIWLDSGILEQNNTDTTSIIHETE
ncbi:MAG: lytic transglycosylase domain-containing protein [Bacteroidetes bacterium]|nr:lytic transglycosylase domain-containing protein [Bacteroidota bacterium]